MDNYPKLTLPKPTRQRASIRIRRSHLELIKKSVGPVVLLVILFATAWIVTWVGGRNQVRESFEQNVGIPTTTRVVMPFIVAADYHDSVGWHPSGYRQVSAYHLVLPGYTKLLGFTFDEQAFRKKARKGRWVWQWDDEQ